MTHSLVVLRHIDAPPDRVWSVLTDIEHAADVIGAIQQVELHTGPDFEVGTRWTETRTMLGRTARETMEVTAIDPGRSYVVEADSGGTVYRSEFRLRPEHGGTDLRMTFLARPSGPIGKLAAATLGRLLARTTRTALLNDLDDIARASEARD